MKMNPNTTTLDQFKTQHYGPKGTKKREAFERGYEQFKVGALIHDARIKAGLTQEQLAQKVGSTRSYISKIENDIKEVRISNLQKIVELGLGGEIGIKN